MNILDRYIMKQFVATLVFAIIALCSIFLIVNMMESLDDFIDSKASFSIIARYYLYFFPEILKLLTPVAVLVSTLFTMGKLSSNNEVTAMKSGGMSLRRLMAPFIVFSVLLSIGQLYFNGWIVPKANTEKLHIERTYLEKSLGDTGPVYNLYFRDLPTRNVLMQYYNAEEKTGFQAAVEEYTSETTPRLKTRMEAQKISWDSISQKWKLIDGIKRTYDGDKVLTERFKTVVLDLKIRHGQLLQLRRKPEEMNFDDKKQYISILQAGGKDVRKQQIEYYGAYAFPFANFIVILFGVPFASVKKKGGIAIQIAAAMIIAFGYLVFTEISKTIGFAYDLNVILTGWSADIIFFIAGLVVLFKTRT